MKKHIYLLSTITKLREYIGSVTQNVWVSKLFVLFTNFEIFRKLKSENFGLKKGRISAMVSTSNQLRFL